MARSESNALSKRSAPKGFRPELVLLAAIEPPPPVSGFAFVYILQSADGTYYVGQSVNIRERIRKHRLGLGSKHTNDHPEVRSVFVEGPMHLAEAVRRESQIKRWSRAKKEALIRGDLDKLHDLSKSRETKIDHETRIPETAPPGQIEAPALSHSTRGVMHRLLMTGLSKGLP